MGPLACASGSRFFPVVGISNTRIYGTTRGGSRDLCQSVSLAVPLELPGVVEVGPWWQKKDAVVHRYGTLEHTMGEGQGRPLDQGLEQGSINNQGPGFWRAGCGSLESKAMKPSCLECCSLARGAKSKCAAWAQVVCE